LTADEKLLLGVNTFYDQEYPYRHGRASLGLEARTTVGEINFNRYWATTSWQAGQNGLDEHALGGLDLEIGIPLPYMNWATFYARAFKWHSEIRGEKDSIGNDLSFRAEIPVIPGLAFEAGHRQYSSNEASDNFLKIEYDLIQAAKKEKAPLFTSYAYKMASMKDQRLKKVRRENKIYKQKKSSTVTVKGF
jgi:adhesin/invasin